MGDDHVDDHETVCGRYVVAVNTATERRVIADRLELDRAATVLRLASSGDLDDVSSSRWSSRPRDWALFVVSPPGQASAADVGDASKYVVVEST